MHRPLPPLLAAALCIALAGCGSSSSSPTTSSVDPLTVAKDPARDIRDRVAAVQQIYDERLPGPKGADAARESIKTIAWSARNGPQVRLKALEVLLNDSSDPDGADTRAMMALLVPIEPNLAVTTFISQTAATRNWKELAPPLVRSWARRAGSVAPGAEDARPEKTAIAALFPDRPVEETVFAIFTTPIEPGQRAEVTKRAEDARRSAWEVLSRLDPSGSKRTTFLASAPAGTDPLVASLKACAADLLCVPTTGSQLRRLERLRDFTDPAAKAWWDQTKSAIGRLGAEQTTGLALRHVEAIRWASLERPSWIGQSRDALYNELRERLKGRNAVGRNAEDISESISSRDRLSDWKDTLVWADLITILAVDDAIHAPGVATDILDQADRDRKNTITEYGGIIQWRIAQGATTPAFACVLFVPRPTQQTDDRKFVASDDMLIAGTRSLGHYHLHAQQVFNRDYAGPSAGDYEYAIEQGVPCVVFTQLREGLMNADYYHAGGTTIDLGDIRSDTPPSR